MDKQEILEQNKPVIDIEIPKPVDFVSTTPEYYKPLYQQNVQNISPSVPSVPNLATNSYPLPNPYTLSTPYNINSPQFPQNYHSDPLFSKSSQYSTNIPQNTNFANVPQQEPFSRPYQQQPINYHSVDQYQQQSTAFGFVYESAQPPKVQIANQTPLSIRSRWNDIYRELDSFSNIMYIIN